ncbi:MAG: phosphoribosyl carboxyaminoimidazole mutase, partial [Novipirellula sp. JB048]
MPNDPLPVPPSTSPAPPGGDPDPPRLTPQIADLIASVAAGTTSVAEATAALRIASLESSASPPSGSAADQMEAIDGATVDLGRQARCGFGEVIFGEGKGFDLIARIIDSQLTAKQTSLVTRLCPQTAARLTLRFPASHHNPLGRTFRTHLDSQAPCPAPLDPESQRFHVAVVTAGSTDAAVAAEAT